MRGRKPKARATVAATERSGTADPVVPADVARDPIAAPRWNELLAVLRGRDLQPTDGETLRIYCLAFARHARAVALLNLHGLVVESATGALKPHPCVAMAQQAEGTMLRCLDALVMTPARQGRSMQTEEGGDDLDRYLSEPSARSSAGS